MHVRSFEIVGVDEADLRRLHDYLLQVGGFEFRAGGAGFFVLVGEKFVAASGASSSQLVVAAREDDTINVDVVASGGARASDEAHFKAVLRLSELLRAYVERGGLALVDV